MTNVPFPTFGPRGFQAPLEPDVLAGVQLDFNAAFGGNLNPGLSTPQGQLAMSETAIIGNVNAMFVDMSNQFNPSFADGRWQDGLAQIYFITRKPALPTVTDATCYGSVGLPIPTGSLAQTSDGTIFSSIQDGVIGADGTVVIPFASTVPGAIPCPAGTLNVIYQTIVGWESINNLSDGVIGQDTESREDFEYRRFLSVAGNATGALPAIRGAVLSVDNVIDAYVTENVSSSPVTIGGVTLAAKSLYVAAVGGLASDIAEAIWTKKSPGCSYNGNTTVTVYDTSYSIPQPSYDVSFERPAPLPIIYSVILEDNSQVPADVATLVQDAIIAAFSGSDGGARARIGGKIFASRFYKPIGDLGSWAQIVSIHIGCQNTSAAKSAAGSITGTTFTESGTLTGAFAIGQTLVDATGTILPGTKILSGASPTWTINQTQTVSAEAIYGVIADQDDVTANIDQSPTISAANIGVSLI